MILRGTIAGMLALGAAIIVPGPSRGQDGALPPRVLVVTLEDQLIQPVTEWYLSRGLRQGGDRDYQCVILQLDTPGGLLPSTRRLVKQIVTADVPVIVYIAPTGARVNSAGVFITLAAHLSAMAPGTAIGSAYPLSSGSTVSPALRIEPGNDDNGIPNNALAWARGLAELRGHNADWATRVVRDGIVTPSKDARKEQVVDFLATDLNDLLNQLDSHRVSLPGRDVVLRTKGATIEQMDLSWPERTVSVLANPTLAYVLLLLGFSGLTFELAHPGTWVAGSVGGLCLLLAFVAMQMLPINYVGLALIVLGLALVVLEVKIHTYGMMTMAGIVSLLIGSALLIEPVGGVERVSWLVVAPVSVTLALIMLLLVSNVLRVHQRKVRTGMECLIGAVARVKGDMDRDGYVYIQGELWRARSEQPLQDGEAVSVQGYDGLTLYVKPTV